MIYDIKEIEQGYKEQLALRYQLYLVNRISNICVFAIILAILIIDYIRVMGVN